MSPCFGSRFRPPWTCSVRFSRSQLTQRQSRISASRPGRASRVPISESNTMSSHYERCSASCVRSPLQSRMRLARSGRCGAGRLRKAGRRSGRTEMSESVYRVIEVIGTSAESWEQAARVAVERAAGSLRELRVAEVVEQDVQLQDGKVELFRIKLNLSFRYEGGKE